MATDLYSRTIAFDYGDEARRALMEKVWSGTPWMVNARSDSPGTERFRQMTEWCRDRFGDEALPIHGRPGKWQSGTATIYGWTWFGFARREDMDAFAAAWETRDD